MKKSIPSLENGKYEIHEVGVNIVHVRNRGSPLEHSEEMGEGQQKSSEGQAGPYGLYAASGCLCFVLNSMGSCWKLLRKETS